MNTATFPVMTKTATTHLCTKIFSTLLRQIQLNHLLEMIANGEPNKESQFLDFIQIDDLQKQLSEIPEIKGIFVYPIPCNAFLIMKIHNKQK